MLFRALSYYLFITTLSVLSGKGRSVIQIFKILCDYLGIHTLSSKGRSVCYIFEYISLLI